MMQLSRIRRRLHAEFEPWRSPALESHDDLMLLRAWATYPWATDGQLARALGRKRPSVARARVRLRRRGLCVPRLSLDVGCLTGGPFVVVCGRGAGPDPGVARGLGRILEERGVSGAVLVEGGAYVGALFWPTFEEFMDWSSGVMGLADPGGAGFLLSSLESYPFSCREGARALPMNFRAFLEKQTEGSALGEAPGAPRPMRGAAPRPLRPTERVVARGLLERPGVPIAQAAMLAGVSRSTFAHVKASLIGRGVLREDLWINLPALGFPVVLVAGLHRRPQPLQPGVSDFARMASHDTAMVSHFQSPSYEFVRAPFPSMEAARVALANLDARKHAWGALSPPFAAAFALGRANVAGFALAGDLVPAWLLRRASSKAS